MRHEIAGYLEDIRLALDDAMRFMEGMGEDEYLANPLARAAVERQLTIAGEAVSQLAKRSPETAAKIPEWREVISFRNILVHGYRMLDHRQVYRIMRDRVPSLRAFVATLIAELDRA